MRKLLASLVIVFLLLPTGASAAIARAGTPVDGGNNSGVSTSLTFSVTVPSGASLFVAFAGDVDGGADDCASVTFNTSENLTMLQKNVTSGVNRFIYLAWIATPTATTANVVITCGSTHYILGGAAMYTGVQAASQPDVTAMAFDNSTTIVTSFTTVAANDWGILVGGWFHATNKLASGTRGSRVVFDGLFGTWALFDTNSDLTAGPNTMEITGESPNVVATAMAAMIPSGAAPPTTRSAPCLLRLLGIGCH